jgi:hypothetical protein
MHRKEIYKLSGSEILVLCFWNESYLRFGGHYQASKMINHRIAKVPARTPVVTANEAHQDLGGLKADSKAFEPQEC